ncbi:STE like transcription factor-domain-containing protein [Mycena floridula]|nr:STE like transcription factor-domain-containing protein [Mycena floridula]
MSYNPSFFPAPIQTSVSSQQDPQEYTARPSNAHSNALWFQQPSSRQLDDTPGLDNGLTRPLKQQEQERLAHLDRLKFFLATAPSRWDTSSAGSSSSNASGSGYSPSPTHPALNRFLLPSQEFVTCVLWNGLYHITGTDIVRALVFRFEAFGRPVRNMKKFEEGVFSDLRNLKPGVDACLEEPKSPFLDLLFKYQCIRTQKKQKVFYWFSVPHDRLFLDALERDLKREKMGMEATTVITGEPALSFVYDSKRSLYEQFSKAQGGRDGEGDLERAVRKLDEDPRSVNGHGDEEESSGVSSSEDDAQASGGNSTQPFFNMFSLFEGSPTYKQRRKKTSQKSGLSLVSGPEGDEPERGRPYRLNSSHTNSSSPSMSIERSSRNASPHTAATNNMSAADLFMKQARGELANPNGTAQRKRHSMIDPRQVGVYYDGVQGVNPISAPPSSAPLSGDFSSSSSSSSWNSPPPSPGSSKAHPCPLLSCGRQFKQIEELKRHLRTHTMDRPFTCPRCPKTFSRRDNLVDHVRVHGKDVDLDFSGMTDHVDGELIEMSAEDIETYGGSNSAIQSEYSEAQEKPLNMEADDVFGMHQRGRNGGGTTDISMSLNMFGGTDGLGMGMGMGGALRQQHSNSLPLLSMNASMRPYAGSRQNSAGVSGVYGGNLGQDDSQYLSIPGSGIPISISAPSHKQAFDHSSLYQSSTLFSEPGSAGGAVRRHRSMTPSIMRSDGPTARRPLTANSMTGEFPADAQPSSGRGYHPYPASSRNGSAHNSPMGGILGLPVEFGGQGLGRSSSRASSLSAQVHDDQMNRLSLGSDRPGSSLSVRSNSSNPYAENIYRTESPAPFANQQTPSVNPAALTDSPSHFMSDLPSYHPQQHHAQTAPPLDKNLMYMYNNAGGNRDDQEYAGYSQHPQHVSTI